MTERPPVIPALTGWHEASELHNYFVCDVYTSQPLQGNQLAVFVDGRPFSAEEMQSLAREMNFGESIFLLPPDQGGDVRVRIFTPGTELAFAGSPILGTAFVVGQALGEAALTIETGSGLVPVSLERDGDRIVFGRMKQPIPSWQPFEHERELFDALGITSSGLPVELYCNGPSLVYVALETEEAVAALEPDMATLKDLGVSINCFAGRGRSWKTRMFYPAAGIPEDPATGAAAGPLAVHLARHRVISFGEEIEIRQGAEIGRPSLLYARATGTSDRIDSVEVGGVAVIVAEGRFRITQA